jgi:ubiquinone biosynthesis monooxygenase Coq7
MTSSSSSRPRSPRPARLPGDRGAQRAITRAIRVDHAGEYGAARIYAGQLAVLGSGHPESATIQAMADQEQRHLDTFNRIIRERRIRPTLLHPVWHAAGFALGAATALLGPKAAMACTVAVEEEIDAHYAAQREALAADDPALTAIIEEFRHDEVEHQETARAHGAEQAPGFALLSAAIKLGCRVAIRVSERI